MPYAVVIIPAAHVPSARALEEVEFELAPEVAAREFVPAASPTGTGEATHYWLATSFTAASYDKLKQLEASIGWGRVEAYSLDTDPLRPWALLSEMQLIPTAAFP